LQSVILNLNPNAEIIEINQQHQDFGSGIMHSELISTPTVKTFEGKIDGPAPKDKRNYYLVFQKMLQDYLDARKSTSASQPNPKPSK